MRCVIYTLNEDSDSDSVFVCFRYSVNFSKTSGD